MVGGGVKKQETELQAITREIYEELGLRVSGDKFKKLGKDVIFIANIPASAEDENNYKFEQYGDTFLKLFHMHVVQLSN